MPSCPKLTHDTQYNLVIHRSAMRKITLILTSLTLSSSFTHAIDALSPVERFLGNDYDPEEYSDLDLDEQKRFAPESPADTDLGHQLILQRNETRAPIRADLSTNIFWTDNVASTSFNENDGFIWQTRAYASWKPRLGNNFFADTYIGQSIYRYDSPSFLDYERTDARVGLIKVTPDFFDILFYGRYEYARVTSGSLSDRVYDSHRFRVGAHKVFFSSPKHTAYVALDYAYDLETNPSTLERDEYSAHIGYTYRITDRIRSVFYSLQPVRLRFRRTRRQEPRARSRTLLVPIQDHPLASVVHLRGK